MEQKLTPLVSVFKSFRLQHNPIGLDLELLNQPLKDTPESPRSTVPGASSFGVSPGPDSVVLGTAL